MTRIELYGEVVYHVLASAGPTGPFTLADVALCVAGPGGTVARQLAVLGYRPRLTTVLGADELGDTCHSALTAAGVETRVLARCGRTARIVAELKPEAADYQLIADVAGAASFAELDVPPPEHGSLVYVTGFPSLYPVVDMLAAARQRAVVDTGFVPLLGQFAAFREHLHRLRDVLGTAVLSGASVPERDWRRHARLCLELGAGTVIVTLGAAGSLVLTAEREVALPALDVAVRDPLCAGDSYVAGYLAATSEGLGPLDAARYGQEVAEAKVATFGGLGTGPRPRLG